MASRELREYVVHSEVQTYNAYGLSRALQAGVIVYSTEPPTRETGASTRWILVAIKPETSAVTSGAWFRVPETHVTPTGTVLARSSMGEWRRKADPIDIARTSLPVEPFRAAPVDRTVRARELDPVPRALSSPRAETMRDCPYCMRAFTSSGLREHELYCRDKPTEQCTWCHRRFSSSEFVAHREHCSHKPFTCALCGTTRPGSSRELHMQYCSGASLTRPTHLSTFTSGASGLSPLASSSLVSPRAGASSASRAWPSSRLDSPSDALTLVRCPLCDKEMYQSSMDSHMMRHDADPGVVCDICGETVAALEAHIDAVHLSPAAVGGAAATGARAASDGTAQTGEAPLAAAGAGAVADAGAEPGTKAVPGGGVDARVAVGESRDVPPSGVRAVSAPTSALGVRALEPLAGAKPRGTEYLVLSDLLDVSTLDSELAIRAGEHVWAVSGYMRDGWLFVQNMDWRSGYVPRVLLQEINAEHGCAAGSDGARADSLVCHTCYPSRRFVSAAERASHMRLWHPTLSESETEARSIERKVLMLQSDFAHARFGPEPVTARAASAAFSDAEPDGSRPLTLTRAELVDRVAVGAWRGIQGENNSCYLDSLLFALFAFNTTVDKLLEPQPLRAEVEGPADPSAVETLRTRLRETIVRPLRQRLFVRGDAVVAWRKVLNVLWAPNNDPDAGTCEEQDSLDLLARLVALLAQDDGLLPMYVQRDAHCIHAPHYTLYPLATASLALGGFLGGGPTVQELLVLTAAEAGDAFVSAPAVLALQLPREYHSSAYERIYPNARIVLPGCGTALELFAILAIDSSHFVAYTLVTLADGTRLWVHHNSMGDTAAHEGSVPLVSVCHELAGDLADVDRLAERLASDERAYRGLKKYRYAESTSVSITTKTVLADAYVCLYRPQAPATLAE